MVKISTVALLIVLVVSLMIITSNGLHLGEGEDRVTFAKMFGKWAIQAGKNTKNLVGQAIHQDWIPDSEKNKSDNKDINKTDTEKKD